MKTILPFFVSLFLFVSSGNSQYQNLSVKEKFDLFNRKEVNSDSHPWIEDPNNDDNGFGDGMAKILEGYITMYETTKDKAYLVKFVLESMCMMENSKPIAI